MKLRKRELPYINSADLFDKVADQPWAIYLDSGVVNAARSVTRHADYDLLAIEPEKTIVFYDGVTRFYDGEIEHKLHGDPIAILRSAIPEIESQVEEELAYQPGALGYFSYDLARQYEKLPDYACDDEQLPEMAFGIYPVVVLVDHVARKTWVLQQGDSSRVSEVANKWDGLIRGLFAWQQLRSKNLESNSVETSHENSPATKKDAADLARSRDSNDKLVCGVLRENMDRATYQQSFDKVRQYTIDGDCYQVNLSKQFSTEVKGNAWRTYQQLREDSPAPYGAYMNFPFAQVLSNSPESFIQCRKRQVITSPIKGTRPRDHHDPQVDKSIAQSLFDSEKDRAENLMIVDLMRNDISKCCELGSVKVPQLFSVHSFANVHHLISTITGTLKSDLHALDLLRSCFPGGSITGAPKIRAMEVIEELEHDRRGLYCGAIGYVGADGSMETNIAIRTIVVKDGIARFSAGGGLVIDSKVSEEYQEIIDKASMMTKALFDR